MESFDEMMTAALDDVDLQVQEVPRIDLYMDQILTLFNESLSQDNPRREERCLTKTMINNYSKERLIMPVKGKKYSREQVMQLLCILSLKQMLPLSDIKCLTAREEEEISFERVYAKSLELKERLRKRIPDIVRDALGSLTDLSDAEQEMVIALALSSGVNYLRRICENMIDSHGEPHKKEPQT